MFDTPRNVRDNLWDYIREHHKEMISYTQTNKIFDGTYFSDAIVDSLLEEIAADTPDARTDYNSSNMGDITSFFNSSEKFVRATKITRASSIHYVSCNMIIFIHTFRGRLQFSFIYNTQFLTHNVTNEIVDRLDNLFKSII